MKNDARALLVAATACIASLLAAPAASAQPASGYDGDVRRCATHREMWVLGEQPRTRDEVETRWETRGLGRIVTNTPFLGVAWRYPVCERPDQWAIAVFIEGELAVVAVKHR